MNLNKYIKEQHKIQALLGNVMGNNVDEIAKENILAMIVESTELLNEFNWKLWRANRKNRNYKAITLELVDIMRFFCNILDACEISEVDFDVAWHEKSQRILERSKNGY